MKQNCGCYDGPYSDATPGILVSVRCQVHSGVPVATPKHALMERLPNGEVKAVAPRERAVRPDEERRKGGRPRKA